jgi:FkbM family methyltransferase
MGLINRVISNWREGGFKEFLQSVIKYTYLQLSFFTSRHRRLVVRAKYNREKIHYHHPVSPDGVILDIGAYTGVWIAGLNESTEFGEAHLFEPVSGHLNTLQNRFEDDNRIHIHDYGVDGSTHTSEIAVLDNSSSVYSESNIKEVVELKAASQIVEQFGPKIDIMKVNVEGSEYNIISDLIESGKIKNINTLVVQFHKNVEDYSKKRNHISNSLKKTHTKKIDYPYVWEVWRRSISGKKWHQ